MGVESSGELAPRLPLGRFDGDDDVFGLVWLLYKRFDGLRQGRRTRNDYREKRPGGSH
jgi:hypothetical protein